MIELNRRIKKNERTIFEHQPGKKGHNILIICTLPKNKIELTNKKTIFHDASWKTMRKGKHSFIFINKRPPIGVDFEYQILINKTIENKKRHFFAYDKNTNPTTTVGIYSK